MTITSCLLFEPLNSHSSIVFSRADFGEHYKDFAREFAMKLLDLCDVECEVGGE